MKLLILFSTKLLLELVIIPTCLCKLGSQKDSSSNFKISSSLFSARTDVRFPLRSLKKSLLWIRKLAGTYSETSREKSKFFSFHRNWIRNRKNRKKWFWVRPANLRAKKIKKNAKFFRFFENFFSKIFEEEMKETRKRLKFFLFRTDFLSTI